VAENADRHAAVAMSPKAGAHGELCGLLAIRAALEARGDARKVILVPESAHGTNPATAAFAAMRSRISPRRRKGAWIAALQARLAVGGPDCNVAAVMITNPNTCGLFEREMKKIADAVHAAGAFVYCDGANFNAIVGRVRPATSVSMRCTSTCTRPFPPRMAVAGRAAGRCVLSEALAPFAPLPIVEKDAAGVFHLIEEETAGQDHAQNFGRMVAFHGQMGMFTRALAYILSHGADGLRQVAEDAVLNANYILRSLEDVLDAPFGGSGPCMHEALFSDKGVAEGFTTLDIAKGLIDEGYHPMTMYFPLVVHGAMLIEPTETESKAALDQFIMALRSVAERAKAGDEALKGAPHFAPRRRLDETLAARKPKLVWEEAALAEAAG
jgi:glycine dehydrogenase subunit 2